MIGADYEAKIQSLQWPGLEHLWQAIEAKATPEWEAGKAFEYLVIRGFELSGAKVRWPFSVPYPFDLSERDLEQIDGVVYVDGLSCLVESKDENNKKNVAPIAKLRNQLLRRPASTIGLMFSRMGFTEPARILAGFTAPQTILLWSGEDVAFALRHCDFCDPLRRKFRAAVEQGQSDYSLMEVEIP